MAIRVTKQEAKVLQHTLDGGTEEVKPKRPRKRLEALHQTLLFTRRKAFLAQKKHRELRWMYATLNGVYIPPALLKQVLECGLVKGVLDIWLPTRRIDADGTIWSGLVIDLKVNRDDYPTTEQKEWAAHLVENGYRVHFCYGVLDAWWTICCYLGISGDDHAARDLEGQVRYLEQLAG